jgi:hypothetical protein
LSAKSKYIKNSFEKLSASIAPPSHPLKRTWVTPAPWRAAGTSHGVEDQPVRDGCRTFLIVVRIVRAEGGAELWWYYVYFTIIILPTYDVFSGTKYIFLSQLANTATSSPADDVHHYVFFQKLLDSIFKKLPFIRQWEIQTCRVNTFLTRWQRIFVATVNALCACAMFYETVLIYCYFCCWEWCYCCFA